MKTNIWGPFKNRKIFCSCSEQNHNCFIFFNSSLTTCPDVTEGYIIYILCVGQLVPVTEQPVSRVDTACVILPSSIMHANHFRPISCAQFPWQQLYESTERS